MNGLPLLLVMVRYQDHATHPWVCGSCQARFESLRLLEWHEEHYRPVLPFLECACGHAACRHVSGSGTCVEWSCACDWFEHAKAVQR